MERVWGTLAIGTVAALMIAARRWNNDDPLAGYGIAGWSVFLLVCIWG